MEIEKTIVDYVWIGGKGEIRMKTRVLDTLVKNLEDIPPWNYDGSSTYQTYGENSEIFIYPQRLFKCPFRTNSLFVICDTYKPDGTPHETNHRFAANEIFERYLDQKPWYGLEQEYFIYDYYNDIPVGFPHNGEQGQYYCATGGGNAFCRHIVDHHLECCLYAGIQISGTNGEVAPGQWEFQIGPVEGIAAADQLIAARYILNRISERYDVRIIYDPKPVKGDWNGSGCHTNFSTEAMRVDGGYEKIIKCMKKLEARHQVHMSVYGENNFSRMSGAHETSSYDHFTYGIGSRKSSVRIPTDTVNARKGYFEDRRPAANIDPYQVTSIILETVMME